MKKYLITGATSMLGVELAETLCKENIVYAVVRKNSEKLKRLIGKKNIVLLYYSMHEYFKIENDNNVNELDGVFHLSWDGARGEDRNNKKLQEENFIYSLELFKAVKSFKPRFFFGIGSQAEYGKINGIYSEDVLCMPDSQYGYFKNKTCREIAIECQKEKISFIWGRVFSAFGINDYQNSLIMIAIQKFKRNEELKLTPCKHIWNYTYISDIVKGMLLLIENNCTGIYNLTNCDNIQLKEYIEEIHTILHSKSVIKYGFYSYSGEIPNMLATNEKLVRDTGYRSDYSFLDGIKLILRQLKD